MLEAVVVGDLHIYSLKRYFPEGKGDDYIYMALESVMKYAAARQIKHIILLGDIFDHPFPEQIDIARFISFVMKYPMFIFWAIPGNHDYSKHDRNSLHILKFLSKEMSLIKNLRIFSQPSYETIEKVPVFFAPWPHYMQAKDEAHLCIGHFSMKGAQYDNGAINKRGPLQSDLKKKDYWIIGDLHTRQVISDRIEYPGTLYQLFFHDTPIKGFSHITANVKKGKLLVDSEWIKFDPPFLLQTYIISDLKEIRKLPKDNNIRLKLLFAEGVYKPKNLPNNVVDDQYLKKDTDIQKAKMGLIDPKTITTNIDPRYKLRPFLKTKTALKKQERDRAYELITDYMERKGIAVKQ